ncbi:MAG TPA: hypothetical protein VN673_19220 [Clostridia bacterium]|nr:hypothetical protein [Clostridia bacterium]
MRSNRLLILFVVLLLVGTGCVFALASYFWLGSDVRALRDSTFSVLQTQPRKTLDFNVGWLTTSAVRAGAGLVQMPPEVRAAIHTVHRVEAGHYTLPGSVAIKPARILTAGDKAMLKRGWSRAVTVVEGSTLVAVYVSDRAAARNKIQCCVLVLHERDLVVASAQADPAPLLALAAEKVRVEKTATFLLEGQ